jgi:hypothetical protein
MEYSSRMFLKSRNLSLSELSDTDTVPSISISKEYIMYRVEENEENSRTVTGVLLRGMHYK